MRDIPLLPGAEDAAVAGVASSLMHANASAYAHVAVAAMGNEDEAAAGGAGLLGSGGHGFTGQGSGGIASEIEARQALLLDPQTGGGLLAALPASSAAVALEELKQLGYAHAAVVGDVNVGGTGGGGGTDGGPRMVTLLQG